MARRVEPNGSVIATDLDTRFLDEIDATNVQVRVHNIVTDPLDQDFDLIHARTVLGHLPERIAVIAKLVAALRPGGWLLLEDVDISGGVNLADAQQFGFPASLRPTLRGAYQAMEAIGAQAGFDGEFGRELPRHLVDAGLVDVDAEACSRLITGGSTRSAFYELSYRGLADAYVGTGRITRGELDALIRSCGDPDAMMMSAPVVSAWGRRTT
jgi:SAM-dependent methyltransferase